MRKADSFQDSAFGKYTKVEPYSDSASNDQSDSEERDQQNHHLKKNSRSKTYLNKISDIKRDRKSFDQCQQNIQQKDDILRRNRQSAKQCRERKKIYINLLQKQVQKLKGQIQSSKNKIKGDYQAINKLISQIDFEKSKIIMNKIQSQKKLSNSLNNATNVQNTKQQTSTYAQSYLYKFDVNGKYKLKLLDLQFEQIVRLLFDHKLLVFWEINLPKFQNHYFDILAIQPDHPYHKISAFIQFHRNNLFRILRTMKLIKQQINDQGQRIQYLVQQLAKNSIPGELLSFLIHPLYEKEKKMQGSQGGMNGNDSFASLEVVKKKIKRE